MTLYRYIINEIWPTFLASLLVFIFIMVAARMLSITELIVTHGVRITQVLGMVLYLLPDILTFALPAVTLMSVVVAFLRLSADSEIIALKSSGISLYQMLPPVVAFSLLIFLIGLTISVFAAPWGNRAFKDLIFKIAESRADLSIKERVFCEPFDNLVLYVNNFSREERVLKDVFVVDRRDKDITNTIVADEGRIIMRPDERIITIYFAKGTIFAVEKNMGSARTINFNSYSLNIGLKDVMADLASRRKAPHELSVENLIQEIRTTPEGENRYNSLMRELLEKGSIPLAVLFMGIIGVPIGAQIRARGRSVGVGISLAVFSIYYLCLMMIRSICSGGALSPAIGVWIPDVFLIVSILYLLRRAADERSFNFFASGP
ncbi:MAG: LPS export ABC transporter permease LptF [Pseudomonadota bacterium]|jgi:lipopolysaccharide export system permease protein|nr:LPS export ABC transporter permease LptF [Desulfobacterales bacterium]MBL6967784.1 LPS export ABC transporter permease LptF [Desulfobacteraceae bacterium]MBL7101625.1 LPS export ABC transporter permease LptF [Desulfobacteraceae bacterium]MBL7172276.1 LPS export ABC transporter permease LptF [Desulfobacteraceae bacterium]